VGSGIRRGHGPLLPTACRPLFRMKITENQEWYLSLFQRFEKNLDGEVTSPLHKIRKAAIDRFAELGFPTTRDEEWKFTDVSPILKRSFKPALRGESRNLTAREIEKFNLGAPGYPRIVFVNGHYVEELSNLPALENGIRIGSLAAAIKRDPGFVEQHLAVGTRRATPVYDDNGFTALNTAFIQDGAFVYIPDDVVVETPIHLLFVSTEGGTEEVAPLSQPRNLMITGKHSQGTFIESYVSLGGINPAPTYFTNAITEIMAGENSIVDHYKLQHESEKAFHIGSLYVRQERQSHFSSHSLSWGGALVRNNITVRLDAEGSECILNGLYMVTGRQHVDNHTTIDHAKPHCTSNELYKGILDGKSRGVFNGRILVRQDAQKTNAYQMNKNLLLSDEALIDTKPQLEIFANDVKCSHGATIGQLEEDAVFYLRSRGINREAARTILIYAFASDVISRIRPDPVRIQLDEILLSWLASGVPAEKR